MEKSKRGIMNGPPLRAKSKTCKVGSAALKGALACRKRYSGDGRGIGWTLVGYPTKIERYFGQKCMKNLVFSAF
jgi:hypothetical protein